jgi:hypothetical protein
MGEDMTSLLEAGTRPVGRKKHPSDSKRYGTLVRVSDEFAEALRDVVSFEKTSIAEYADAHLLPIVRKRYRDAVIKKARNLEGGEK